LGNKRWWLTGEEFLAQVEARRAGHEVGGQKPIDPTPSEVIEYFLKSDLKFTPKKNTATGKEAIR
jgi:hypothetical protein